MNKKLLILSSLLISFSCQLALGQGEDYYLFPVRSGEQNYLAGTMGEMRGTHFHAGIDIKTGGVIGYPIYAAADGYVSRIKVTSNGYGNALYIAHPNGQTTVYAHLHQFKEPIASFVLNEQYKRKSFRVDIFPDRSQFVIKKGEVIAEGGNSGGSTGPHLHFEIRDANQNVLNPLNFKFEEIRDTIPPILKTLVVSPLSADARIDGAFKKKEYVIVSSGKGYKLERPLNIKGRIGFELLAYDKLNGARNKNGIKYFELKKDGNGIFQHDINKLSFSRMKSIKAYMDYPEKYFTNRKINKLFIDDGNDLGIYNKDLGSGTVQIDDNEKHSFSLVAADAHGNRSTLNFESNYFSPKVIKDSPKSTWKTYGNVLKISKPIEITDTIAEIFINGVSHELDPAYTSKSHRIFLWDLSAGLPDYIDLCDGNQEDKTNFVESIVPGMKKIINHERFKLIAEKNAVFDTLHLQFQYTKTEKKEYFEFMQPEFPTKKSVIINLKLATANYEDRDRSAVYSVDAKDRLFYAAGDWIDDKTITFKTKVFGKYTIASDTLSPKVKILKADRNQLKFTMEDDLAGIKTFNASINGEFLLLEHRHKLGYVRAIKKNKNIPLSGMLEIIVKDNVGNETIIERKI